MTRSEAASKAGKARAKAFTPEYQRAIRKKVSSTSCARNGSLGAKATIAKYGYESLFQKWHRWKLNNPSQNELLIVGILAQLKIGNERDWRIGSTFFTVDFYLPGFNKAIEVNGKVHKIFDVEQRLIREAKKLALLTDLGIDLLAIDYTELRDVPAVIEKIKQFVGSGWTDKAMPAQTGNG
jgi:hypothetical protein